MTQPASDSGAHADGFAPASSPRSDDGGALTAAAPPPLPAAQPSLLAAARPHRNHFLVLYGWFASAYYAQGVFQAYSGSFEQPLLESCGVGLEAVGFAQAIGQIPWIVKIIFALPSDAWDCGGLGYRRPYALGGLVLGASFLAVLAAFATCGGGGGGALTLPGYVAVAVVRNLGVCVSDVATDGLAVDCDRSGESGQINAVMTAGRMVGLVVASSVAGAVADALGYSSMILVLSALVLAVAWLPLLLREERVRGGGERTAFSWAAFARFREPTVLLFLASACASNAGLAIAAFPMSAWQRGTFGFSLTDVGLGATVASVGLLVGSAATGPLFDRVSKRGALLAAGAASSLSIFALLAVGSREGVFAARFFAGCAEGSLWIVQSGLTMRLADKRAGASFFALAIMAMNFAIMAGNAAAGSLAQRVGLDACFVVGGVVSLSQLLPLPWLALIDVEEADGSVAVLHKAPLAGAAGGLHAAQGTAFVTLREDVESDEPAPPPGEENPQAPPEVDVKS